jgi:replicative DNA helicase
MTTKGYDKVFGELVKIEDHGSKFWIVDGNLTATIDDIWAIVRQLKPDAVFVDGAYLVKVQDKRLTKWDRIGYVAEDLKSKVATNLKVPVFASYQFNKQMLKKKDMTEVGLDDIYGSDVIGQVSSVVLGVFDDPSVESLVRKRITLLKGRNGEVGSFEINWDFLNMDFSEVTEIKNDGLKYA